MRPIPFSLILLSAGTIFDQDNQFGDIFPRKPIKVIVPFGAGGGTDTFTRIIQKAIEKHSLLSHLNKTYVSLTSIEKMHVSVH